MNIRPFDEADEPGALRVWQECGLVVPHNDPEKDIRRKLRVNPEWFLVGEVDGEVIATCMAGYEGHRGWINYLAVLPAHRRRGLARQLMEEAGRLLRAAGCPKINLQIRATNAGVIAFYERIGFTIDPVASMGKRLEPDGFRPLAASSEAPRELPPPPAGYSARMPRFAEAASLTPVGLDFSGRDAFLAPGVAVQWQRMKASARDDGLELLMISGFRSHAFQAGLVARKLADGMPLEEILRVNAYPGLSEHHSGRAVDIGSRASHELTEDFEDTREFRWLSMNAHRFGFALSFPRGNPQGMIYEPWHWANFKA